MDHIELQRQYLHSPWQYLMLITSIQEITKFRAGTASGRYTIQLHKAYSQNRQWPAMRFLM